MKGISAAVVILVLVFSSCAWFEPKKALTASELAAEGMEEFNAGNYRVAIQVFGKLRNFYPFSKYAILAELKVADALYKLGNYEDAIVTYGEFENLHPQNEATPYVINQIGLSHFGQVDTIDREQVSARKALDSFRRLVAQFPDSLYAAKAKDNIEACYRSLSGHELEIGIFYYKSKQYAAAINRFRTILTEYPDVGEIHHQALQILALSEASLKEQTSEK